jgi:hypothetical protein
MVLLLIDLRCIMLGTHMAKRKKTIIRFALYGAVGFGVGGIIFASGYVFIGFLLFGALGGLSLGLALKFNAKKLVVLALSGALGLWGGIYILFLPLSLAGVSEKVVGEAWLTVLLGLVAGALLGTILAVVIDRRLILRMGLAGAMGFGLGFVTWGLPFVDTIPYWLGWCLVGLIGGASLGAALGYLNERGLLPART